MSNDLEALPDLVEPHEVPDGLVESFRADGHGVVRGLASPDEVAAYAPRIEARGHDLAWDRRPLEERNTYGKAFLQSFNLWRADPAIARFVRAPRFAEVAAALLGVTGIRLYHDQGLFKEPGGGPTPWHQDQFFWPLDTDATVTMWMPLVPVPTEVGSMSFASGSHLVTDLRGPGISDASEAEFARRIADLGLPIQSYGAMAPGDATFHKGWTVHSAGPNPTETTRTVMTVIYVADGAHVSAVENDFQEFDRRAWLGGREAGQLVDHPRNPLLWAV